MASNFFDVEHDSGYGSYRYLDTTLTTNDGKKVTLQHLTSFFPQQITLIKLCENLEYLITTFKFTNLSITMPVPGVPGDFVYNNLEMKAVPAVNADVLQSWVIKWNTEDGKAKKLLFKRMFIRKSAQAMTSLYQAEAAGQGHSLWGGNKRRKKTKRKKIKRKKTKNK
jgi:hypothetical protein